MAYSKCSRSLPGVRRVRRRLAGKHMQPPAYYDDPSKGWVYDRYADVFTALHDEQQYVR